MNKEREIVEGKTILEVSIERKYTPKKSHVLAIVVFMFFEMFLIVSCNYENQLAPAWNCSPIPQNFLESDLIGIWEATYAAKATDTLILREDGTYKQVFNDPIPSHHYESGWNRWWLEKRNNNGAYIHLESMRRCDNIRSLCEQHEGGGGEFLWWDFCGDEVIQMPGEVVLIVTGVPDGHDPSPRGIWLRHLLADPDSGSFHFSLLRDEP